MDDNNEECSDNLGLKQSTFDKELFELLPHRPPMLLINKIVVVDESSSSALVYINDQASFYEKGKEGVPAWIGLEYMGQTAALIAGYQFKHGIVEPHLGFLLGTRRYEAKCEYFAKNKKLLVSCQEKALVGETLATFDCSISYEGESDILATANLSVFRKPKNEIE